MFCFDSARRSTVQTLIETSDAILLDLRGFGPQRAGTGFELAQLASLGRLDRWRITGDSSRKQTRWTRRCKIDLEVPKASLVTLAKSLAQVRGP
jgi:hypothetical protein